MSEVQSDRRAAGASRIKYEALVEVGGAHGPSFEAQAIDLSEGGMHLRTPDAAPYLPEPGQPLTCRFDMAEGGPVLAAGEVAWVDDDRGEFGLRFTGLDAEAMEALERVCGPSALEEDDGITGNTSEYGDEHGRGELEHEPAPAPATFADGARVRLHIEGLGAPMRARVRHAGEHEMIACSDLAFLQIGRPLELEHADNGAKRAAQIGGVNVEMSEGNMPQLVVKLRYAGAEAMNPAGDVVHVDMPSEMHEEPLAQEKAAMTVASEQAARAMDAARTNLAKLGPAMVGAFGKAREAVNKLRAQKAGDANGSGHGKSGEGPNVQMRRTSPAPGGGLHTSGRKVIRGASPSGTSESDAAFIREKTASHATFEEWDPKKNRAAVILATMAPHKSKIAAGSVLVGAALLMMVALHKPAATAPLASTDPNAITAPADPNAATNAAGVAPIDPSVAPLPPSTGAAPIAAPASGQMATNILAPDPELATASPSEEIGDPSETHASRSSKPHHVEPFGNGPVAHGNVIHLKMDGPIEKIEGGVTPNGFSVVIPGRKSLDAAGPLAQRDERIGSIKMSNNGDSAELNVSFRDGVPNYQVRAHGDVLEIALAPIGALAEAKHGSKERRHVEGPSPTRKKHHKH